MVHRLAPRTARRPAVRALFAALVALAVAAGGAGPALAVSAPRAAAAGTTFLNLSATNLLSFVPATLTVTANAPVVLRITQAADFEHTFTLSSVANVTLPDTDTAAQVYAFFTAHPPLVNLSLGSVAGAVLYANFTAPPTGSYEFLCEAPGHFQAGMHGELVSGSGTTSHASSLTANEELVVTLVVVVAIVAVVALFLRARRRGSTAGPPPPAA